MGPKTKYAKICGAISLLLLIVVSVAAVSQVGFLLGWLTGASRSPVVPVVAPLVFGLLAAFGIGVSLHRQSVGEHAIWRSVFVAFLTLVFCTRCYYAVTLGAWEREDQYSKMSYLLGETAFGMADHDTLAALYRFRLLAKSAEVSSAEFEPIISDLVKPILEDGKPDAYQRVKSVLSIIEPALSHAMVDRTDMPKGAATPKTEIESKDH
jgi:hypothetical protein